MSCPGIREQLHRVLLNRFDHANAINEIFKLLRWR